MINPRISVCIPAYNNESFIAEAIESVLAQTFGDFELLVIDDCSLDRTRQIVASYATRDSRIVLLENSHNLGMVHNWNRCLKVARGEFIKFLFGDDLLSASNALENLIKRLLVDSKVALVASARYVIDVESRQCKVLSHFRDGVVLDGTALIRRSLCEQRNQIGEPSVVMFRKSQATRGFDPRYRQLVDLEMWLHLLEQGDFSFIGAPLTSFRVHPDQQTQKNLRTMALTDDMLLMFEEYLDRPYLGMGRAAREFLFYNQYYRIWKSRRNGIFSREEVLYRIRDRYFPWQFFMLWPIYKLFSPLWKVRLKVDNFGSR